MFTVDSRDKRPIYQQIVDNVVLLVTTGVWNEGDKLPSIRSMAQDLGVNANTVARAYTDLEYKNIIETAPQRGSFVTGEGVREELIASVTEDTAELVEKFTQMGVEVDELREIMEAELENAKDK